MESHNIALMIRNRELKTNITRGFQRRYQVHSPFVERLGLETELELKEKKKQAKKEGKDKIGEEEDPEKLSKLVHSTTVKLFADYEIKRRAQEEKDAELRKRQREQEIAEEEAAKKKKEWEKEWEESRTNRVDSWRSFQAGGKKKKKEKKGRTAFKPPALRPEKR